MTDNEIIKALECHASDAEVCKLCPLTNEEWCSVKLARKTLDLINRLNSDKLALVEHLKKARRQLKTAKSEAVKEFAEQVQQTICENTHPDFNREGKPVNVWNAKDGYRAIDDLLKKWGEGE